MTIINRNSILNRMNEVVDQSEKELDSQKKSVQLEGFLSGVDNIQSSPSQITKGETKPSLPK